MSHHGARRMPVIGDRGQLVGMLTVEAIPWAEVYVNGEYRDETPLERPLVVAPGTHTLTLKHPTLGTLEAPFTIVAEESKTLKYNLNQR